MEIIPDNIAEEFFNHFCKIFNTKSRISHVYSIAEKNIRINYSSFYDLSSSIKHLLTNFTPDSDFDIYVFEKDDNDIIPNIIWDISKMGYQGDVIGFSNRFYANYDELHGLFQMIDMQSRKAIYYIFNPSKFPGWENSSPFRIIFYWWAKSIGGHIAHAASVGILGDGVLIIGKGGSGKSTISLESLFFGFNFIGDDYVLLKDKKAYSLYNSLKIKPLDIYNYFTNKYNSDMSFDGKNVYLINKIYPQQIKNKLNIKCIIIPEDSEDFTIKKENELNAFLSLAPSTTLQFPGASNESFHFLREFIKGIPVYRINRACVTSELVNIICNHQ